MLNRCFGFSQYAFSLLALNMLFTTCLQASAYTNVNRVSFKVGASYEIDLNSGVFYGPGRMPDAAMPKGKINEIIFDRYLVGKTPFFNNDANQPNLVVPHDKFPSLANSLLSDGTPINENLDGGIVDIGQGAMSLLNVVAANGPNNGEQTYYLDDQMNWVMTTDLALDPGFKEGLLIIENLQISTGLIWVPLSLQTQENVPGGADMAGSIVSGTPLVGRLGDKDNDGFLDGDLVGKANIPLQHIFSPGAPAVQLRSFTSSIPVTPIDAALLTIAGLENYHLIWQRLLSYEETHFLWPKWQEYLIEMVERVRMVHDLLTSHEFDFHQELNSLDQQLQALIKLFESANAASFASKEAKLTTEHFFATSQKIQQAMMAQSEQLLEK